METEENFERQRHCMLNRHLKSRDIIDERVISAFSKVPRHKFVNGDMLEYSYEDEPLPIGMGQTISQPYIAAYMTQLLELNGGERILEIGTGSGYQAAVLSLLCDTIYSIERIPELKINAEETVRELGYRNIHLYSGDGTKGLAEHAPFDRIIITAASPEIPPALLDQLDDQFSIMVAPVGNDSFQRIFKITKNEGRITKEKLIGCIFVPLIADTH